MNSDSINICPFDCSKLEYGYDFVKCIETNQYLKFNEKFFCVIRPDNCTLYPIYKEGS